MLVLVKADEDDGPVYEEYPEGLTEGIIIQGLTKVIYLLIIIVIIY